MIDDEVLARAEATLGAARARAVRIVTAESCTGGLVAAALTAIAGSSDVVERGFITYSNAAKTELLGVPATLIARDGAVSATVAAAMVRGALDASEADLAVAVTGIAGPGGGSPGKPVGLVWFSFLARDGVPRTEYRVFSGDRARVRRESVLLALDGLCALAAGKKVGACLPGA